MLRTELDAVRSALQARRDALLAERLARDPEFESLRDRVIGCRIQLESLPWGRVGEADIKSALKRSARRVRRAADSARRSGESEELHRWRRRLRRVGQQLNALASAGLGQGDAVRHCIEQAHRAWIHPGRANRLCDGGVRQPFKA